MSSEPGITDKAYELGADPSSWADEEDGWVCPGCNYLVQPSDARRHASECPHYTRADTPASVRTTPGRRSDP